MYYRISSQNKVDTVVVSESSQKVAVVTALLHPSEKTHEERVGVKSGTVALAEALSTRVAKGNWIHYCVQDYNKVDHIASSACLT